VTRKPVKAAVSTVLVVGGTAVIAGGVGVFVVCGRLPFLELLHCRATVGIIVAGGIGIVAAGGKGYGDVYQAGKNKKARRR